MSQTPRNRPSAKKLCYQLPMIALLLSASSAFAAAPTVVVDAQETLQTGLNAPQSIALAPNNSYYVADAGNNQVLLYSGGNVSKVSTGSYTLFAPQAVAVDSAGDLFIGDSPSVGVGRVIEASATGGVLSGTVTQVVLGGALKDVTALTVDTNPASSTFNTLYIGDDLSAAIYSVAAASTTLVNLNLRNLPSPFLPSALIKDAAGDLFIADLYSTLWRVRAGSSRAATYAISDFTVVSPTGLALDPKGELYILTDTSTGATPSQTVPENIIEVPLNTNGVLAPNSAFQVPVTGLQNSSGIGIDTGGNVYVVDFINNNVTELVYGSPVGLSQVAVNTAGPAVTFNYELNAQGTLRGFKFVSSGDTSTEIQLGSGGCSTTGQRVDGNNGGAISPSDPYTCQQSFSAEPAYPGLRYGAIELKGSGSTILASTEVYSTGLAGASVVYPLNAATGASGLVAPQGLAVSGLDKKLYIVDNGGPAIYSANGPNGTTLTPVSTAPVTLSSPLGIAINGEGDLYIADLGLQELVVVPAITGETPYTLNPGNLLQNPVSVAFDTSGNLFIGDLGPAGLNAGTEYPAYIVEVPVGGGAPFKVNTGATQMYFPGAIAADPYTGALMVADAGYDNETDGIGGAKVLRIPAGGGSAADVPGFDGTNPVGIAFDPAEEFYVLDGTSNALTVVPPAGGSYTVELSSNSIASPSAFTITNGGQDFVVANFNSASNNLVYLNGKRSRLSYGSLPVGDTSATQSARINNIGSSALTLANPYITAVGDTNNWDLLPTTTCAAGLVLQPATACDNFINFTPFTTGTDNVTATFQTNGYLPSDSVLVVAGRGTGTGSASAVRRLDAVRRLELTRR